MVAKCKEKSWSMIEAKVFNTKFTNARRDLKMRPVLAETKTPDIDNQ